MVVMFTKVLRKIGLSKTAAVLLRWTLKLFRGSAQLLQEYCINRISGRDFDAVIQMCEMAASKPGARNKLKDTASYFLNRASIDTPPQSSLLIPLRNSFRREAAASLEFLEAGMHQVAGRRDLRQAAPARRTPVGPARKAHL